MVGRYFPLGYVSPCLSVRREVVRLSDEKEEDREIGEWRGGGGDDDDGSETVDEMVEGREK